MRHDAHYVEELSQHQPAAVGRMIGLDKIDPNPEQPRVEFGDLTELTASIAERASWNLYWSTLARDRPLDDYCRRTALPCSTGAGLTEVPCVEMDIDAGSVAEIALIENMQRKDLTVWEKPTVASALREIRLHT